MHRIPIGIDIDVFRPRTTAVRLAATGSSGCRTSAFVVGSFQKDGVGWAEGLEPKLIKGPDVLLAVCRAACREPCPSCYVLLTGPARGYVRSGLDRLGIPYRHPLLPDVDAVAPALPGDRRLPRRLARRGWAAGCARVDGVRVPLVTTRVGQAADLVRHGENGWMVEPEDVEGLVACDPSRRRARRGAISSRVLDAGRRDRGGRTPTLRCDRAGGRCSRASWRSAGVIDASAARAGRYGRAAARWARLLAGGRRDLGSASSTATIAFPRPASARRGARSKFQKLAARFPNTPVDFSLLYLGTTLASARPAARSSRSRGAAGSRSS